MGVRSATPKGAAAKVARGSRRRARGALAKQSQRTAINKLRRINRERAKSKQPPLTQRTANGITAYYNAVTRRYSV